MSKLAIICNDRFHAREFVIQPFHLKYADCIIITPEKTERMHGYRDIEYYELRPMYARELDYAKSHGWKSVTREELEKRSPTNAY